MKKIRCFLVLMIIAILNLSVVVSTKYICTSTVLAENNIFSATRYTDNDYLLKENGEDSEKTIKDFSTEVKRGVNLYYPELAEVIPRQYLESSEENATFSYNGKEYGFYVAKDHERFDVLLIDFSYEFDDTDLIHNTDIEFRTLLKPLLQQSFIRTKDDSGAYTWKKTTSAATYYVGNPRFLSEVKNENANCPAGRFLPTGQLLYSVNQRLSECSILNFGTQFGSTASIRVVTKSRICFSVYFSS
jgi:hypothetical protein